MSVLFLILNLFNCFGFTKCDACIREKASCLLPEKNRRCNGCAIKRKVCLWGGKRIPKKKGEVKEVEETKGAKRGPKRPVRTASAPGPSQKRRRVQSSEEEEEEIVKEVEEIMEVTTPIGEKEAPPSARMGIFSLTC